MRGVLSEALGDETRAVLFRQRSQGASRKTMQEIASRAVERGEIDRGAITPRRLEVGRAMLRHHFLFGGVPIPDEVIVEIVDEVLIPLFRYRGEPSASTRDSCR
jgi:hypothetical protein